MPARDGETGQMSRGSRGRCVEESAVKTGLSNLGRGVKMPGPESFGCRTKRAEEEGEWVKFCNRKG